MITVHSQELFVTSVAKAMIYDFNKEKLVEHIMNLEKTADSNKRSNAGGFQSINFDHQTFDTPYAEQLIMGQIMEVLHQVAEAWGFPKSKNISYWYNVNRKYNYNHTHYHQLSLLSGVIYLKVPKDSGRIMFTRANSESDRMDFITTYQFETSTMCPDNPNINVVNWEVPRENLLLVFPGHLEHYVEQNLTTDVDDSRISISFNYFI
jgi:uncharacterized protein (TIGR02466 family)